ncbi:hypothetical protein H1O16_gp397 [Burkholderia phage BcepSaruman]|uniref:Uncharacterized protein n=1 Tax=Burkholderia phage BcepSaruman TaxID=2530032 RepID=A0A4D5ZDM5_9CAUD|nr:hypothetical protein H1O16_gp397 [Burkholderia phage BcepSaruman]QBX06810.1 hypothetical protein BcepSaruman_397 [Burkholderia phage BcepSaruman]
MTMKEIQKQLLLRAAELVLENGPGQNSHCGNVHSFLCHAIEGAAVQINREQRARAEVEGPGSFFNALEIEGTTISAEASEIVWYISKVLGDGGTLEAWLHRVHGYEAAGLVFEDLQQTRAIWARWMVEQDIDFTRELPRIAAEEQEQEGEDADA